MTEHLIHQLVDKDFLIKHRQFQGQSHLLTTTQLLNQQPRSYQVHVLMLSSNCTRNQLKQIKIAISKKSYTKVILNIMQQNQSLLNLTVLTFINNCSNSKLQLNISRKFKVLIKFMIVSQTIRCLKYLQIYPKGASRNSNG